MMVQMPVTAENIPGLRLPSTEWQLKLFVSSSLLTGGKEAGKKLGESRQEKSKYICKLWWMVWTPGNFGRINNIVVSKVHKQIMCKCILCKTSIGFLDKERVLSSDDE